MLFSCLQLCSRGTLRSFLCALFLFTAWWWYLPSSIPRRSIRVCAAPVAAVYPAPIPPQLQCLGISVQDQGWYLWLLWLSPPLCDIARSAPAGTLEPCYGAELALMVLLLQHSDLG